MMTLVHNIYSINTHKYLYLLKDFTTSSNTNFNSDHLMMFVKWSNTHILFVYTLPTGPYPKAYACLPRKH